MKNLNWLPIAVFGLFLFLFLFPVLIVRKPYVVEPKIVGQGESFTITADYCKLLPIVAKYQIVYEGELYHPAPEVYASNAKIGCNVSKFHFKTPDTLPPGDYKLRLLISYPPILRTFEFVSDKFVVVENKTTDEKINDIINVFKEWGIIYETVEE